MYRSGIGLQPSTAPDHNGLGGVNIVADETHTKKLARTPEEKARLNAAAADRHARRMANETPEHREARLAKARATEKARRARDPSKVREKNARSTEKHRERRNAEKCAKRAANPELIEANRRNAAEWRIDNVDRAREFRAARHAENKDAFNAASREWHARNRDLSRAKSRAWQAANREKAAEDARRRRKINPGGGWARRKLDTVLRLTNAMRCRLRSAVVRGRGHKSSMTFDLIGCTPDALRAHIESQFEQWMTWDNYGSEWHVDHIRQCSLFDLTDPQQQRECFNYSNLRPLSVADNLSRPRHRRKQGLAIAA